MDELRNDMAETLAAHWPIDDAIDLEPHIITPSARVYNLPDVKLTTLMTYTDTHQPMDEYSGCLQVWQH